MAYASRRPRLKLGIDLYQQLHQGVLKRDRWRCQYCGSMSNLEVHHIQPRGRLGDDAEENLITLCALRHHDVHLTPAIGRVPGPSEK